MLVLFVVFQAFVQRLSGEPHLQSDSALIHTQNQLEADKMSEQNCALLQLAVPLTVFAKKMPGWWAEDHWLPSQHAAAPEKSWARSKSPSNMQMWFGVPSTGLCYVLQSAYPWRYQCRTWKAALREAMPSPAEGSGDMEKWKMHTLLRLQMCRQTEDPWNGKEASVWDAEEDGGGEKEEGDLGSFGEVWRWSMAMPWHLDMVAAPPPPFPPCGSVVVKTPRSFPSPGWAPRSWFAWWEAAWLMLQLQGLLSVCGGGIKGQSSNNPASSRCAFLTQDEQAISEIFKKKINKILF